MKKAALYLLITLATFSLSSFGIVDNPKSVVEVRNSKNLIVIAPKSVNNSNVVFLNDIKSEDCNKENDEPKNLIHKFFAFVYSVVAKIVISIIS